jgi:hypothetical protein
MPTVITVGTQSFSCSEIMFHEYQYIPESFKELGENIRAQNRQLKIPRIVLLSR